jgi:hypothetical protein
MLDKVEDIYTIDFFEAIKTSEIDSASDCMQIIIDFFNCQSIIDLGCGSAIYLKAGYDLGLNIMNLIGFDGSIYAPITSLLPERTFVHDLRTPLVLNKKYDLCICIEVAEHLDKEYADILIDNIVAVSNCVFFTAAIPGQGGHDHRSEMPNEYWIEKFEARGFQYLFDSTEIMRQEMTENNVVWWISQNLMLFEKRRENNNYE